MNSTILLFADGTVFFIGLALVLISNLLFTRYRKTFLRPLLTVVTLIGITLVAISSTPIPVWAFISWLCSAIVVIVVLNSRLHSRKINSRLLTLLTLITLFLFTYEIPYHLKPTVTVSNDTTVYVIGDSISAGVGTGLTCWPVVLDKRIQSKVINLAQAGATIDSALRQLKGITQPNSLVIVEIGGNDLLGGTSNEDFYNNLNNLLSKLQVDRHKILLFEIPLFPFKSAYGQAQRKLAEEYNATLLPKRFFSKVLGLQGGTIDALHLSQSGHNSMATIIEEILQFETD